MRFFFDMNRYARTAESKNFKIIPIDLPFSLFDFVDNHFKGLSSLRRILSQVRINGGKTMVIEEIGGAGDIIEENEDIKTRYPDFNKSTTYRLSFFKKKFSTKRGLSTSINSDFIGYAIVKSDDFQDARKSKERVYESVVAVHRSRNYFVRGAQNWLCRIIGNNFTVKGYIYAQQNGMTNVCAHVALRAVASRYHKNGDMSYREMNKIVGINHIDKKAGGEDGDGLSTIEMVKVLEAAGANCFVGDYFEHAKDAPAPFQKYVYGSIESGFPAIIIFDTAHGKSSYHAIPVFGHTFNENTWVPNADFLYFQVGSGTRYIPSESWISMFIAHDDNCGSNYCIPHRYLDSNRICDQLGEEHNICPKGHERVAYVIGTLPKEVKTDPIRAEVIGADYLFSILYNIPVFDNPWYYRLKYYADNNRLVLRPIIVGSDDYTNHLQEIKDWEGNKIKRDMILLLRKYLQGRLYWLIELSVPELFSANRRKVGEVLLRADVDPGIKRNFNNFVIARLPGNFVLYDGGGPSNPRYTFIPSGVKSHVELYGTTNR